MQDLFSPIKNIQLLDDNCTSHNFMDLLRGKTIVLNMFYSHCDIKCVPLGYLMRRVNLLLHNHILKDDISFISITLDARNDHVDEINQFKDKVWTKQCLNWRFFTGNSKDIEKIRYILGMYSPEKEIDKELSNHSGHFLIMNYDLGFIKHTHSFDNPVDIARKVLQIIPSNFYTHSYSLDNLCYDRLNDNELFENIQTMNSMFTVPFLPEHVKEKYDLCAEQQRKNGFQYNPLPSEFPSESPSEFPSESSSKFLSKTPIKRVCGRCSCKKT